MRPIGVIPGEDVVCACCGEESASLVRVVDGSEVCRTCLDRCYAMCDICGQYFDSDVNQPKMV